MAQARGKTNAQGTSARRSAGSVGGAAHDEALARTVEEFRLTSLAAFSSYTAGDPFAEALIVCGRSHAESSPLLEAPAVVALGKALAAMGYREDALFVIDLDNGTVSAGELEHRIATLRSLVELIDPVVIVAADAVASDALRSAYGIEAGRFGALRTMGRSAVLFEDFAAALDDDQAKQAAWRELKQLSRSSS